MRTKEATLLSEEEYKRYEEHIKPLQHRTWWLSSPGVDDLYVEYIDDRNDEKKLNSYGVIIFDKLSVRPALIIKCYTKKPGDTFIFGGIKMTIISDSLALADEELTMMSFQEGWDTAYGNNYNKSSIKKYLQRWYRYNRDEFAVNFRK